ITEFDSQVRNAAANLATARATNAITARIPTKNPITGETVIIERAVNPVYLKPILDSIMRARGGTGVPSSADSNALRGRMIQDIIDRTNAAANAPGATPSDPNM